MDRRKIVYYNSRSTQRAPVRKKSGISLGKVMLAISFIAVAAILQTLTSSGNKNDNNPQQVLAEQTTTETPEAAQELKIDSPLQNVPFPTTGQAAIGTLEQGVIKHTENEAQAPIASMTKVITALVVLEKRPLERGQPGDTITLTDKDAQYFNDYYAKLGTVTAITVGASMTQYEALQAMLLPSSNNMSDTLVDRYFSSQEEYLKFANDYLQKNGLSNTVVADASGFSPGSKSTPSDMIKLGQLALKNPVVKEIVAQPFATLSVAGDVPNYNQLISEPGVIGIKPGTTDEAGYCLLFAANLPEKNGQNQTVIAVSMGQTDRPVFLAGLKEMLQTSRLLLAQ